jgi:hypothetical protein
MIAKKPVKLDSVSMSLKVQNSRGGIFVKTACRRLCQGRAKDSPTRIRDVLDCDSFSQVDGNGGSLCATVA